MDKRLLTEGEKEALVELETYDWELVDRIAKAQLAKADKARSDREKIAWANSRLRLARWLYRQDTWDKPNRWKSLSDSEQERYCKLADQHPSLFNPEAIRREVAEEIFGDIKMHTISTRPIRGQEGWIRIALHYRKEYWQSLKSRLGGDKC